MNPIDIEITKLIPQRPPIVMVDRVLSSDRTDTYTELTIREDNIFLDDNTLSTAGIMENMMQSCAARMGCINRGRNESIKIGYIGAVKECDFFYSPKCNDTLTTHVHILEEVFHLTLADITVKVGEILVAQANVKIVLTDKEAGESKA